ncbi:hypothetical protein TNCV_5074271 [Trichonephila clavipes]|nr:hypothetical protein TNCV_5074271 [Trichonephila clavipes]
MSVEERRSVTDEGLALAETALITCGEIARILSATSDALSEVIGDRDAKMVCTGTGGLIENATTRSTKVCNSCAKPPSKDVG